MLDFLAGKSDCFEIHLKKCEIFSMVDKIINNKSLVDAP